MVTSSNPYFRKIGLNLANHLFFSVSKNNHKYLDLFFKRNEREAIGRRILIAIYILEGYKIDLIADKIKCGRETINQVKKDIDNSNLEKIDLLEDLRELYFNQFNKRKIIASPKTVLGTNQMLGLEKNLDPRKKKVIL